MNIRSIQCKYIIKAEYWITTYNYLNTWKQKSKYLRFYCYCNNLAPLKHKGACNRDDEDLRKEDLKRYEDVEVAINVGASTSTQKS